jgi:hypothetical protein
MRELLDPTPYKRLLQEMSSLLSNASGMSTYGFRETVHTNMR